MSLLHLKNITKSYGAAMALDRAHLDIEPGEIHGLMGENGAGKSTLLKILAGVVSPDNMDMLIDGQKAVVTSPQDAFSHGFRFVHQELNIVPQLSVAENIVLGRQYPTRFRIAVNWRQLNRQAGAALERLHLSHINPARKMARLGTGDQMLVRIASLLVSSQETPARLYVMDEPTAALTGQESERLFQVVRELKKSGASVIYVSHRMNEIIEICDRVTVLRDGKTVATQDLADTNRDKIIRLMTGRERFDAYPGRKTPVSKPVHVSCTNLSGKNFHSVDFSLLSGEILGVAGLANSGQSDLLLTLIGANKKLSGTVSIKGQEIIINSPANAWRSGIAYIPRERRREGLMLRRSIVDNIALPHLKKFSRIGGAQSRSQELRHSLILAQEVALKSESLSQPAYQLSGGNQQKLMLARAIGDAPELLLLDEPTRGVDVGAKYDIYSLIRNMSANGTAVIITSSDLPELLGMCDRILIMRGGVQHAIVPTKRLKSAELLAMFYD